MSLGALFPTLAVTGAAETSLPGAQALSAVRPWTLRVAGEAEAVTLPILPAPPAGANLTVALGASDIRTFVLTLKA